MGQILKRQTISGLRKLLKATHDKVEDDRQILAFAGWQTGWPLSNSQLTDRRANLNMTSILT
jgi:hypothetical protein